MGVTLSDERTYADLVHEFISVKLLGDIDEDRPRVIVRAVKRLPNSPGNVLSIGISYRL